MLHITISCTHHNLKTFLKFRTKIINLIICKRKPLVTYVNQFPKNKLVGGWVILITEECSDRIFNISEFLVSLNNLRFGEDLGGVGGGKTITRIYCMNIFFFQLKELMNGWKECVWETAFIKLNNSKFIVEDEFVRVNFMYFSDIWPSSILVL